MNSQERFQEEQPYSFIVISDLTKERPMASGSIYEISGEKIAKSTPIIGRNLMSTNGMFNNPNFSRRELSGKYDNSTGNLLIEAVSKTRLESDIDVRVRISYFDVQGKITTLKPGEATIFEIPPTIGTGIRERLFIFNTGYSAILLDATNISKPIEEYIKEFGDSIQKGVGKLVKAGSPINEIQRRANAFANAVETMKIFKPGEQ